jgi:hypothetical protein
MLFRLLVLVLVCFAPAMASPQEGLRPGESCEERDAAFPGAGPLADDGTPLVWAVRIEDSVTGRPLPDAIVRVPNHVSGWALPEEIIDLWVERADDEGWVRIPTRALEGWRDYVIADAPGYAANEHCLPFEERCALERGTDVPVVLIDYLGRPVPHAKIGFNLCCGHIADQRSASTDASGCAVFRSILPGRHDDVFVYHPELHFGAFALSGTWRPGSPPVVIHASPGIVVEGQALLPDGTPWRRACIGEAGRQRPWVRTDDQGRFRLMGVTPWAEIAVYDADDWEEPLVTCSAPPEGIAWTLVRGEPIYGAQVRIELRSATGEVTNVRVSAVRSDGFTVSQFIEGGASVEWSLPPGSYEVSADGELGTWGRASQALAVGADDASITLEVPRNPTVRVDAARIPGARVGLTTARDYRLVSGEELERGLVTIPEGERAMFRITDREWGELVVNFVEIPPAGAARDAVIPLDLGPTTTIRARPVGPEGEPTRGS